MRRPLALLAAVNAVVLAGAATVAAAPLAHTSSAKACMTKHHALTLVAHGKCAKGSTRIAVTEPGPRGPKGLKGATGKSAVAVTVLGNGSEDQVEVPGSDLKLLAICQPLHAIFLVTGGKNERLLAQGRSAVRLNGTATATFPDSTQVTNASGPVFVSSDTTSQQSYALTESDLNGVGILNANVTVIAGATTVVKVNLSMVSTAYTCQILAQGIPSNPAGS